MNLPVHAGSGQNLPALWNDGSEKPASFSLRRALMIGGGLMLFFILLGIFVPIGGAVLGTGQVGVESRVKRIAHPFGGVIAQVVVANGEHVEKGQLLMRLDDKVSGAGATFSSLTVEQLLAQQARLEAERLGAGSINFPDELTKTKSETAAKAMADEQQLFDLRRNEESQLRSQLDSRVAQYTDQIGGVQAEISSLRRQRDLIEPERKAVRELWDKDLVTINRLNQMERTAADIDGRIASLSAQIAQVRGQITETQERSIQMSQSRRVEAGNDLARILTAMNDQRTRSVAAGDQQFRAEIRAPYAGTVEKIAFASIGEVVRAAEPIMEIVPDSDEMIVEVMVSPTDVDQVRKGQKARVRFPSFNLPSTPQIDGKVTYVATDRTENPEAQMSFFMVRVAVDQKQLAREKLKNKLRSGMPAEVQIATGDRPMLSYITKPLRDQFARAFRAD